jgi:TRAP-type C4-dicarboxylate transport system substrate-binding protein
MKMAKSGCFLIGCFTLFFFFIYMGPAFSQMGGKIKLRMSNGLAPTTFQNAVLLPEFAKAVEEKSKGRAIVELYPAKQLYGHIATAHAVHRGAIEMGFNSVNHYVGYSPLTAFNDYAFLVKDVDSWHTDEIFPIISDIMAEFKVKLLSLVPYSDTTIVSTKLIRKPEDVKGLRIRGISDPFFDCIKSWGGVPAAMSPSEAYDALAKGALDGIMTGWESTKTRKFYDIADYIIGPTASPMFAIVMNMGVWNDLPEDIQKVVKEAADEASTKGINGQKGVDEEARAFLKTKMKSVIVFSPEDVPVWKKETLPAYDMYVQRCAEKGKGELAKKILKIYE